MVHSRRKTEMKSNEKLAIILSLPFWSSTLANILQVVRPIRMSLVASLSIPLFWSFGLVQGPSTDGLPPTRESWRRTTVTPRILYKEVAWRIFSLPIPFVQRGFIQNSVLFGSQSRQGMPRGENPTSTSRSRVVSTPNAPGSASGPQDPDFGDPPRRRMRRDLMILATTPVVGDPGILVACLLLVKGTKPTEEGFLAGPEIPNKVSRHCTPGLFFFEENSCFCVAVVRNLEVT